MLWWTIEGIVLLTSAGLIIWAILGQDYKLAKEIGFMVGRSIFVSSAVSFLVSAPMIAWKPQVEPLDIMGLVSMLILLAALFVEALTYLVDPVNNPLPKIKEDQK